MSRLVRRRYCPEMADESGAGIAGLVAAYMGFISTSRQPPGGLLRFAWGWWLEFLFLSAFCGYATAQLPGLLHLLLQLVDRSSISMEPNKALYDWGAADMSPVSTFRRPSIGHRARLLPSLRSTPDADADSGTGNGSF